MPPGYRNLLCIAAAALACMALATTPAQALDPPNLSLVSASPSDLTVQVTAGPSGAPSGFVVEWMSRAAFDALGGWPADPGSPDVHRASFTGVPTRHLLTSSSSFLLGANVPAAVVPGDLFDETGVLTDNPNEFPASTGYVLRARALGGSGAPDGPNSASLYSGTAARVNNCTYTQGYWKNHPSAWPVTSLTLGTVTYNQSQLLSILGTPAGGNGLLILAHQVIAAKLDIAFGADPMVVSTTLTGADAMIGGLVVPPVGGGYLSPSAVNSAANTLDDYNNGQIGPGHCGTTPVQARTWGALKQLYR
ncbi:MAG TPA: hypothetical protein VMS93_00910 [Candidatus Saccharimonadales bacterium]|nr:hypothetical protein [Candidatus Saccharimonadales bacterium]